MAAISPAMSVYVTEFNYLNHTNFKAQHLFCNDCKAVFETKIYTDPDEENEEANICQTCYNGEKFKRNAETNSFLYNQLKTAKFPCVFEQCQFIGKFGNFHKHLKTCMYGPITCPIDDKKFKLTADFIQHLAAHGNMKEVTLKKMSIAIDINTQDITSEMFVATFKNHYFVVFLKKLMNTISLKVGKHLLDQSPTFKTFTIDYQFEDLRITQEGNILPLLELVNGEANKDSVQLRKSLMGDNVKLTIYFKGHDIQKIKWTECPVCFKQLFNKVRQCVNYHNICTSCASKMVRCPICRENMNVDTINLKHFIPDYDYKCEYFDEGCLEVLKLKDRKEHNKVCVSRKINCPECNMEFGADNYASHFEEIHTTYLNFSKVLLEWKSTIDTFTSSEYIIFRSHVFCVKMTYLQCENEIEFQLDLLNDVKTMNKLASKYRFEVVLLKGVNVIHKVSNICGIKSIKLNDLKCFFLTDGIWNVKCQYNILYKDDVKIEECDDCVDSTSIGSSGDEFDFRNRTLFFVGLCLLISCLLQYMCIV